MRIIYSTSKQAQTIHTSDTAVLAGAHYDSVPGTPGALDSAGEVVELIE
jgi:Zn-dependent M28 family amino/carboxypeptidase